MLYCYCNQEVFSELCYYTLIDNVLEFIVMSNLDAIEVAMQYALL